MHSDQSQCLYCQDTWGNLMIKIADLKVSRAFLFKEQTYRGRCLVAYNGHVNDLNELSVEERNAFMDDVCRVTSAMQKAFNPENPGKVYLTDAEYDELINAVKKYL